MRAFVVLSFALAACGSATIVPATPDATPDAFVAPDTSSAPDAAPATPDAAPPPDAPVAADVAPPDASASDVAPPEDASPPGPCGTSALLTRDLVRAAQVARAAGGYVVAWYPNGGTDVRVQGFSAALSPQGEPLSLPLLSNVENLSLSFNGAAGVLGAGSTLYLLALDRGLNVTLTRRADFPRLLVRQAWMASESLAHGVLADGRYVVANATAESANTPNEPLSPPHGAAASFVPTLGGYLSVEPITAAGGMRVLQRRFVFGHGASLQVASAAADGVSASPTAHVGDELARLVQTEGREVDVSLERRDFNTFALRGEPTLLQRGAAWNGTHGVIDGSGGEPFVAWAAHPPAGGFNSAVQAMWAGERAPREVFHHVRDVPVRVFAAASAADAARAWVLYGVDEVRGGFVLFGRCVDRAR